MTIKILITLNDKKSNTDPASLNDLNEYNLINHKKEAIKQMIHDFKLFLKSNVMKHQNEANGLTITWFR